MVNKEGTPNEEQTTKRRRKKKPVSSVVQQSPPAESSTPPPVEKTGDTETLLDNARSRERGQTIVPTNETSNAEGSSDAVTKLDAPKLAYHNDGSVLDNQVQGVINQQNRTDAEKVSDISNNSNGVQSQNVRNIVESNLKKPTLNASQPSMEKAVDGEEKQNSNDFVQNNPKKSGYDPVRIAEETIKEWDEAIANTKDPEERAYLQSMRDADNPTLAAYLDAAKRTESSEQREAREKKERRNRRLTSALNLIGALGNFGAATFMKDGRSVPVGNQIEAVDKAQAEAEARRDKRRKIFDDLNDKVRNSRVSSMERLDKLRKEKHSAALADLREQRQQLRFEILNAKTDDERAAIQRKLDQTDKQIELKQQQLGIQQQNADTSRYRAIHSATSGRGGGSNRTTNVRFGKNNKHSVDLPESAWKNSTENIDRAFQMLPPSVKKSAGAPVYDKYTPGKIVDHKPPTMQQKRELIEQHLNDYPAIGEFLIQVSGGDPEDGRYDEYFGRNQGNRDSSSNNHKQNPYGGAEEKGNHKSNPYG